MAFKHIKLVLHQRARARIHKVCKVRIRSSFLCVKWQCAWHGNKIIIPFRLQENKWPAINRFPVEVCGLYQSVYSVVLFATIEKILKVKTETRLSSIQFALQIIFFLYSAIVAYCNSSCVRCDYVYFFFFARQYNK